MNVEDVKRISLKPGEILWASCPEDWDHSRIHALGRQLKEVMKQAGVDNPVIMTTGGVMFNVINTDRLPDETHKMTKDGRTVWVTQIDALLPEDAA